MSLDPTRRMTRRIRGADGKEYNLVSYDGITWEMDAKKLKKRIQATDHLVSRRIADIQTKLRYGLSREDRNKLSRELKKLMANPMLQKNIDTHYTAYTGIDTSGDNTSTEKPPKRHDGPVVLPVERHGPSVYVTTPGDEAKGKPYKYRKPRKEPNVRFLYPVHYHRCHGKQYSCSCQTPYLKRPCGGTKCLRKEN